MQLAVSTTRFEAFVQLITLVLIFALVLGLTYFVTRFVGNYQKNKLTGYLLLKPLGYLLPSTYS